MDKDKKILTLKSIAISGIAVGISGLIFGLLFVLNLMTWNEFWSSIALAILTSAVINIIFAISTQKEFSDLVQNIVHDELEKANLNENKPGIENEELFTFWRPFTQQETAIVVTEDTSGSDPTIRATDLETSLGLYLGLLDKYITKNDRGKIKIEYIIKNISTLDSLPFDKNLIVISAPGANPLATKIMDDLKGIHGNANNIKNGYIFAVDNATSKYLDCRYIKHVTPHEVGIIDIQKGLSVQTFPRRDVEKADAASQDCCLVVRGEITEKNHKPTQVLIVAGHSRYATKEGIDFILSNNEWAGEVNLRGSENTESLLTMTGSLSQGRKVLLRKGPRLIQKEKGT
jgi:hypothetical protein